MLHYLYCTTLLSAVASWAPGRTVVRKWEKISGKGRSGCAGLRGVQAHCSERATFWSPTLCDRKYSGTKGDAAPQSQRFDNLSLFSAVAQGGGVELPPCQCLLPCYSPQISCKKKNPGAFFFFNHSVWRSHHVLGSQWLVGGRDGFTV